MNKQKENSSSGVKVTFPYVGFSLLIILINPVLLFLQ